MRKKSALNKQTCTLTPPTATNFATHSGFGTCTSAGGYRACRDAVAAKTLGFMAKEPEWVAKFVAVGGVKVQVCSFNNLF